MKRLDSIVAETRNRLLEAYENDDLFDDSDLRPGRETLQSELFTFLLKSVQDASEHQVDTKWVIAALREKPDLLEPYLDDIRSDLHEHVMQQAEEELDGAKSNLLAKRQASIDSRKQPGP